MDFTQFMFLAALTALSIICFIMCFVCLSKVNSVSKSMEDMAGASEEIKAYYNKIKVIESRISGSSVTMADEVFCKMSVKKFNAFADVTGAVSFTVALLDKANNGIILTSIYGRETNNVYIREVNGGECDINLLKEEREALEGATSQEVK